MPHSSDEAFGAADRGAVEPIAALVAVLAVGAALGLYVGALDAAASGTTGGQHDATAVLDRIERDVTVGGVVRPDRLGSIGGTRAEATVELRAGGETWRTRTGSDAVTDGGGSDPQSLPSAESAVTVRVGPGENLSGRLRVVVHG